MKFNKFVYFVLIIVMISFYVLYVDLLSLMLLVMVILFPFLLLGMLIYLKHSIIAEITSKKSGAKGEEIPVTLHIKNSSFIPAPNAHVVIKYKNSIEKKYQIFTANIPIHPKNENVISFNIKSEYAGCILTECSEIRILDFIKLFSVKIIPTINKDTIYIFPECQTLDAFLSSPFDSSLESDVFSKVKSGDDPSEVFDIREYNVGDKINRIHWKLSIKTDTLMVKENSFPVSNGILLFTDTASAVKTLNPAESLGCLLEVVVSISDFLVQNESLHSILYYDTASNEYDTDAVSSEEETYSAIGNVMRNAFSNDGTLNNMNENFYMSSNGLFHCIFITASLSTALLQNFLDINCENKTVLYIDDAGYDFMQSENNTTFLKIVPDKLKDSLSDFSI